MTVLHEFWRSSAAYRLRIGLKLLDLPYASAPVDLTAGAQRSPENLARNPQGLVPVLEIDGMTLTQTLAILEYLNETRNAGFLPDDPAGRARVRALAYAVAMEIHPVCNLRVARHAADASNGAISMQDWMQHFIGSGLAALEAMLDARGRFCHGDTVTLADICLLPQLYNAARWGVDVTALTQINRIAGNLAEIPAVQAAHPDRLKPQE